jgi:hypothetical protein
MAPGKLWGGLVGMGARGDDAKPGNFRIDGKPGAWGKGMRIGIGTDRRT